jgi:hypothetical protein
MTRREKQTTQNDSSLKQQSRNQTFERTQFNQKNEQIMDEQGDDDDDDDNDNEANKSSLTKKYFSHNSIFTVSVVLNHN